MRCVGKEGSWGGGKKEYVMWKKKYNFPCKTLAQFIFTLIYLNLSSPSQNTLEEKALGEGI